MSGIVHFAADDGKPSCDKRMGDHGVPVTTERGEVSCTGCLRALTHQHRGETPRGQRDAFGQVTR